MTHRLVSMAEQNWDTLDGFAVSQNMPPLSSLPLRRFTSFVWWWATRNAESEQEVEKLRARIWVPPAGYGKAIAKGPWSAEEERAAFGALKSAVSQ